MLIVHPNHLEYKQTHQRYPKVTSSSSPSPKCPRRCPKVLRGAAPAPGGACPVAWRPLRRTNKSPVGRTKPWRQAHELAQELKGEQEKAEQPHKAGPRPKFFRPVDARRKMFVVLALHSYNVYRYLQIFIPKSCFPLLGKNLHAHDILEGFKLT